MDELLAPYLYGDLSERLLVFDEALKEEKACVICRHFRKAKQFFFEAPQFVYL